MGSGDLGAPRAVGLDDRVIHDAACLLYTSDAADERSSVDLGGRRIIKKKNRLTLTLAVTVAILDITL